MPSEHGLHSDMYKPVTCTNLDVQHTLHAQYTHAATLSVDGIHMKFSCVSSVHTVGMSYVTSLGGITPSTEPHWSLIKKLQDS